MKSMAQSARMWGLWFIVLVVALALLPLLVGSDAIAVTSRGQPATTVTPDTAGSAATYTFGIFKSKKSETVSSVSVSFPAGTDVSGATAIGPAGTVSVSGQTVTVAFTPAVPEKATFSVSLGNIVNPAAGTYNAGTITFEGVLKGNPLTTVLNTGDYVITGGYLTMTITTPDPGQSVDFGTVDPGIPSATAQVQVQVDSSGAYTIIRTTGGDSTLMGLGITGNATGAKPAGLAVFTDTYQLTPPWTTSPSVPLTATVVYSVVQS